MPTLDQATSMPVIEPIECSNDQQDYATETKPWSRQEFERRLRAKGDFYHIHHPYHQAMHQGRCTPEQIRGWVANRFYYQINIPVKDANVLANCRDRDERRLWVQRILDHDGYRGSEADSSIDSNSSERRYRSLVKVG